MSAIPSMKMPLPKEIFAYRSKIPCFEDAKNIILTETENGNRILLVGDAACHPSETVVVIDFEEGPKNEYDGLKTGTYRRDNKYQYFVLLDNKGALYVNFGRIDLEYMREKNI